MPRTPHQIVSALASGHSAAEFSRDEFHALIRHSHNALARQQALIAKTLTVSKARARRQQHALLRSLHARLFAASETLKKSSRRRSFRDAYTLPNVWRLAQRLHNLKGASWALAKPRYKTNGGIRKTYRFENEDVARQKLVAAAIKPFARLCPSQFALRGGRTAACKALHHSMNEAEAGWRFLHLDITDFYPSVSVEWLQRELPLQGQLIHDVVLIDQGHVLRWHLGPARSLYEVNEETDRRAVLPQGSAAAPIVAEFVIAKVLQDAAVLLEGLRLFNYSDNLGTLLPPDRDHAVLEERLRDLFQRHPAGPFQLRVVVSSIERPFRFLGYDWQRSPCGTIITMPHADWMEILYSNKIEDAKSSRELQHLSQKIQSYCAAYELCPEADVIKARLLNQLRNRILQIIA